jgi:DMSO/TMAO reductase YedYZ molybdopterin-dependent catalytic subunit
MPTRYREVTAPSRPLRRVHELRSVDRKENCGSHMLTRREWIASTGSLMLSALGGQARGAAPEGAATEALIALPGKKPLIKRSFRPPNYETPLEDLRRAFTANDTFFVRYHLASIPEVSPRTWRLRVKGPSIVRPSEFSLADLKRLFERVSMPAINQCSGNRRGLFTPRVPGVQWGNGAMGNAIWSGVRLRDVLRRCELQANALEVVFDGADGPLLPQTPDFKKSLPVERALDENVLIAFEMNGQPLPHFNGAPARLVVPGWTATYWVKHLVEIHAQPYPFDGFWMKGAYRIPTGAFPGARFKSQETAETTPITQILVNSLITGPAAAARLAHGQPAQLTGWAWDGGTGIAAVDVSTDAGANWHAAMLEKDYGRYAWRGFRFALDTSQPGALSINVRATSRGGEQQPAKLTFNPAGYHDNRIQSLLLEVA